jgi:cytochrome c-type biogenesis protein CcmE
VVTEAAVARARHRRFHPAQARHADYKFKVENNGSVVEARYTGIVPDTFKDGSEVVIKGQLGPEGFVVEPNGVMAKCPSKYEATNAPSASTAASVPASSGR